MSEEFVKLLIELVKQGGMSAIWLILAMQIKELLWWIGAPIVVAVLVVPVCKTITKCQERWLRHEELKKGIKNE